MKSAQYEKTVANEYTTFWMEDHFLFSNFAKPTKITVAVAQEMIDLRLEISENVKQYWCFDITLMKGYTADAMDYVREHGEKMLHACAVIAKTHIEKFIFNTYQLLKGSDIPFKAFMTKEEAIKWLTELRNQKEN